MSKIRSVGPLIVQNLYKEFGDCIVLNNINLSINPKDRIGLLGRNGSGKSTLMRILAGLEISDMGHIVNPGLKIGYLGQDLSFESEKSVYDVATEGVVEFRDLLGRFKDISEKYEHSNPKLIENYNRILAIFQKSNRFQSPITVSVALKDLEIYQNLEAKTSTLSGGQLVKLALAKVLISKPDILLLDEPTNHLDLHANLWLRNFLNKWNGGFVVVSHDRDFLNEVTVATIELNNGHLAQFGGNYSFYKKEKGGEEAAQERKVIRLIGEIRKAKKKIEKEKERAAHSIRRDLSRNPDDLDRFRAHYFKEKAEKAAGKNKSVSENKRSKLIQQLGEAKRNVPQKLLPNFTESETHRGKLLISATNISCSYPNKKVISNASIDISFGDRVAIFGNNGTGKSTLIQALLDTKKVNVKGDFTIKPNINIQYLDQRYSSVDRSLTVAENVLKAAPNLSKNELRKHLAHFLFRESADVAKRASVLSGGEIARLAFAMMTIQPVDLLALDEPTNNLDVDSIEELESVLSSFKGAILIVSHDISFLKNVGIMQSYIVSKGVAKLLFTTSDDEEKFKDELLSKL